MKRREPQWTWTTQLLLRRHVTFTIPTVAMEEPRRQENCQGRGRKRGEKYTRRTAAEIERERLAREKELANRRNGFFLPHCNQNKQSNSQSTTTSDTTSGDTNLTQMNNNLPEAREPTVSDPLPGVNMTNVPPLF